MKDNIVTMAVGRWVKTRGGDVWGPLIPNRHNPSEWGPWTIANAPLDRSYNPVWFDNGRFWKDESRGERDADVVETYTSDPRTEAVAANSLQARLDLALGVLATLQYSDHAETATIATAALMMDKINAA